MEKTRKLSKTRFKDKNWVEALFAFVLVFYCCLLGINSVVNNFLVNTSLDSIVFCGALLFVVICALPGIIKEIKISHLLVAIAVVSVFAVSSIFNNACYQKTFNFFVLVFPVFFVGASVRDVKITEKYMYLASVLGLISTVFLIFFTVFNASRTIHEMSPSYGFLPCAVFILYYAFEHRKLYDGIFAVVSFLALVIFSVRGPIVVFLICLAILLINNINKNVWLKIALPFMVLFLIIAVLTSAFDSIIDLTDRFFQSIGATSRILDRFSTGTLFDSNGRNLIAVDLAESIWKHPFLGTGLFSDREITGTYAHNLFLEFWVDFGIVIGTLLSIAVVYNTVRILVLNRKNRNEFGILITVVAISVGKLMFSGSYLDSPEFFMLLGMFMNPVFNKNIVQSPYKHLRDKLKSKKEIV